MKTVFMRNLLIVAALAPAASSPSTLIIDATPQHTLSSTLYSLFFETEINFGGEGGLYAELLPNRDFETLGRGTVPSSDVDDGSDSWTASLGDDNDASPELDPHEPAAVPTDYRPWLPLNGAALAIDNTTSPFATNPNSLKVVAAAGHLVGAGVANSGFWGIGVRPGVSYNLTLYAQTSTQGAALRLTARLKSTGGVVLAEASLQPCAADPTAPAPRAPWARFTARLSPTHPMPRATTARLEISLADEHQDGTFHLDGLSLMPSDAVGGFLRKDAFERLKALEPGFMRTPGGNYLEGTGMRTRWDWKRTLGAAAARTGHYNSAWGYWVTDGLGVYELLRMCELLESTCQMSIYTGYSMGRAYVPMNESAAFAQDALDLLDYANADPAASTYAALRSDMGHPASFGLDRVEVGNEERLMDAADYPSHYQLITVKLWERYPKLTIVASGRWGAPIAGSPCLTGQRCDVWDDHYYRKPDVMAGMGAVYDAYNRSLPRVFVGEFAAKGMSGSLRAALAEGIFRLGFERNADVVESSSFAPLCNNVKGTQWSYNMLNFNSTHLFTLPAYHTQAMMASSLGRHTLLATLDPPYVPSESHEDDEPPPSEAADGGHGGPQAPTANWLASASLGGTDLATLAIKLVNYGAAARLVDVVWAGAKPLATVMRATVLTADDPDAVNTLDVPDAVVPKVLAPMPAIGAGGKKLSIEMPAWSLVVVTVKLGAPPGSWQSVRATRQQANLLAMANDPIVHTGDGAVRGNATGSCTSFFGIPYAAPPTGARRFRPPVPATPWQGIRDGRTDNHSRCVQTRGLPGWLERPLDTPRWRTLHSEDCLFLNVQSPKLTGSTLYPVVVSIHGGSYLWGSGSGRDAAPLCDASIVYVSFNYRLGVLAALGLPELLNESGTTANLALQDQRLAMSWVQRHIRAFGGDPARVTLSGESSGAMAVAAHLASARSSPLFSQAIFMSGNDDSMSLEAAYQAGGASET